VQANFEVIVCASGTREHRSNLVAEVAFDFHYEAADLLLRIVSAPSEELIDIGVHARGRLSGPDRTQNGDAGIQPALRNSEPTWCMRAAGSRKEVRLAEHDGGCVSAFRIRVRRQRTHPHGWRMSIRDDGNH